MTEQTTETEATVEPEVDDETEQTDPEQTTEQTTEEDPETFPREYVVKLRDESAKYRQRAGKADDLAHRLHTAMVAATGRLADPSDLAFDEVHIDDQDALSAAIDDLLTRKPHLASRRPVGDIGQGASPSGDTVSLAGILRSRAG